MRKKYNRGDIASIYYPNQEDSSKATERYAIVIEDLGDEFILVPLTTKLHQQGNYPDSFVVLKESPDGLVMKLRFDSLVVPTRMTQLPKLRLTPPDLGKCSDAMLTKIERVLIKHGLL